MSRDVPARCSPEERFAGCVIGVPRDRVSSLDQPATTFRDERRAAATTRRDDRVNPDKVATNLAESKLCQSAQVSTRDDHAKFGKDAQAHHPVEGSFLTVYFG